MTKKKARKYKSPTTRFNQREGAARGRNVQKVKRTLKKILKATR